MTVVRPRFVVLDSATLGNVAHDYLSTDEPRRAKSREFISRLRDRGIHITLSAAHVLEVFGHESDRVVRGRLAFLRTLPLVAWLRPYNCEWAPGSQLDLVVRELHAFVHRKARSWQDIRDAVRSELWETGTGTDLFVDIPEWWSEWRSEAQRIQRKAQYVASVRRADLGEFDHLTLAEVRCRARASGQDETAALRRLQDKLQAQIEMHGDRRIESPAESAAIFMNGVAQSADSVLASSGDLVKSILDVCGIPHDCVSDDMTVGDVSELGTYIAQLALAASKLSPSVRVSARDVPPNALPAYFLEHELVKIQRQAARVSGSDMGDGYIAALSLYADSVEVDKRTYEYLTQFKRACPAMADLIGPFFRSSDYADISEHLAT